MAEATLGRGGQAAGYMSRRAQIEQRLERLGEIGEILSAMKNLALIETRKQARFMAHQHRLVESITAAATDFLRFHSRFGHVGPDGQGAGHILILIGSERGFCGDFNETVLATLERLSLPEASLMVVGRRLVARIEDHPRLVDALPGANIAEEVPPLLDRLLDSLNRRVGDWSLQGLSALTHEADGGVVLHRLLPLPAPLPSGQGTPPLLNEAPERFVRHLVGHYLAAQLPALFYGSLMAENRRRLEHMNSALSRIDNKVEDLVRRRNALRQEEITEQIEVILLSVDAGRGM